MKLKLRIILFRILMFMFILIFPLGCSKYFTNSHSIGVSLPLSGTKAESGQLILNALIQYSETINDNGGINGRKIELVVRDDKNDPKESKRI